LLCGIGIISKRNRHILLNTITLYRTFENRMFRKRKRSSGHCLKQEPIHREFPITPVPVDVPTPGHLARYYYYYYYSQSDIILWFFFFLLLLFRRGHMHRTDIAIHTRAHIIITPGCPLRDNGTISHGHPNV
jgi:hypothetical protein